MHPSLRFALNPAQPDPSFDVAWVTLPNRDKHRFMAVIVREKDEDQFNATLESDNGAIMCFPKSKKKSSMTNPLKRFKFEGDTFFQSKIPNVIFTFFTETNVDGTPLKGAKKDNSKDQQKEPIIFVSSPDMIDKVVSAFGNQVAWPHRIVFILSKFVIKETVALDLCSSGRYMEEWDRFSKKATKPACLQVLKALGAAMEESGKDMENTEIPDEPRALAREKHHNFRSFLFHATIYSNNTDIEEACLSMFSSAELSNLLNAEAVKGAGIGLDISDDRTGQNQEKLADVISSFMARKGDGAVFPNVVKRLDSAITCASQAESALAAIPPPTQVAQSQGSTLEKNPEYNKQRRALLLALRDIRETIPALYSIMSNNYSVFRRLSCHIADQETRARKRQEIEINNLIENKIGIEPEKILDAMRLLIRLMTRDLLFRKIFWEVDVLWDIIRETNKGKWKPIEKKIREAEQRLETERDESSRKEAQQARLAGMMEIRSAKEKLFEVRDTMRKQLGLVFRAVVPYHWATGLAGNMHEDIFLLTISIRGIGANNIAPVFSPSTAGLFLLCNLIKAGDTCAIDAALRIPPTLVPTVSLFQHPDGDPYNLSSFILKPEQLRSTSPAFGFEISSALKQDLKRLVLTDADPISKALIGYIMEPLMSRGSPRITFQPLIENSQYLCQAIDVLEARGFSETALMLFTLLVRRLFIPKSFKTEVHPPIFTFKQASFLAASFLYIARLCCRLTSRALFHALAVFINCCEIMVRESAKYRLALDHVDRVRGANGEDEIRNLFSFSVIDPSGGESGAKSASAKETGMSWKALLVSLVNDYIFNDTPERNVLMIALDICLPESKNFQASCPRDHPAWHPFTEDIKHPLAREDHEMWKSVWSQCCTGMYEGRDSSTLNASVQGYSKEIGVPRKRTKPLLYALERVLCIPSTVAQHRASKLLQMYGFTSRWVCIWDNDTIKYASTGFGWGNSFSSPSEAMEKSDNPSCPSVRLVNAIKERIRTTETIYVDSKSIASLPTNNEETGEIDLSYITDPLFLLANMPQISEAEVLLTLASYGHLQSIYALKGLPQTTLGSVGTDESSLSSKDSIYMDTFLTYILRTYSIHPVVASRGQLYPSFVAPLLQVLSSRPYMCTEGKIGEELKDGLMDIGPNAGMVQISGDTGAGLAGLVAPSGASGRSIQLHMPGQRHSLQGAISEGLAFPLGLKELITGGLFGNCVVPHRTDGFYYVPTSSDIIGMVNAALSNTQMLGGIPRGDEDLSDSCDECLSMGHWFIRSSAFPMTPHISPSLLKYLYKARRGDILSSWATAILLLQSISTQRNVIRDPFLSSSGITDAGHGEISGTYMTGLSTIFSGYLNEIYDSLKLVLGALGNLHDPVAVPILKAIRDDSKLRGMIGKSEILNATTEALSNVNNIKNITQADLSYSQTYSGTITIQNEKGSGKKWFVIIAGDCMYLFKSSSDNQCRDIIPLAGARLRDDQQLQKRGKASIPRFILEICTQFEHHGIMYFEPMGLSFKDWTSTIRQTISKLICPLTPYFKK